ncbi:hypothetical protein NP493_672g00013 [Ridgeia piscesae]|uniref:Uncharacterized protein n=1 Tax=Ridgeia piscesae TaxID=27915 RepID=A0AAD9NN95_RIDPI|nr:hypothetical protein NP493_672g00013 [Ridgeia piscesae]
MERLSALQIPVRLELSEKKNGISLRTHIGTMYFNEGTSPSQVCEHVMKRQNTVTGIWLLQIQKPGAEGGYETVTDKKHCLRDGSQYVAMYYNGPDIFLMLPT